VVRVVVDGRTTCGERVRSTIRKSDSAVHFAAGGRVVIVVSRAPYLTAQFVYDLQDLATIYGFREAALLRQALVNSHILG
jgi:hypothetical protein